jgi:hypothetical protein
MIFLSFSNLQYPIADVQMGFTHETIAAVQFFFQPVKNEKNIEKPKVHFSPHSESKNK